MLTLFYSPGACSLASHIILEKLNQPYNAIKVDLKTHLTEKGEDYYRINPLGSVPALLLSDKALITQNPAVLNYLGDLDDEQKLIPPAGSLARIQCLEWLSLISADLHKPFGALFKPMAFVNSDEAKTDLQEKSKQHIQHVLNIIENKLKPDQFAISAHFSVIDAYLFVFYRWMNFFKFDLKHTAPKFFSLCEKINGLEVVKKTLEKEGLK